MLATIAELVRAAGGVRRAWHCGCGAAVLVLWLALPSVSQAGLYYSRETYAELPSQWRGFLLDQRTLRLIAVKPTGTAAPSTWRARYQQAAAELDSAARARQLSADELADLGALHVRLGEVTKAVEVLREAQRLHPRHFRIAANLGTAWQLAGDLRQAAAALQQAVRLAPDEHREAEEYHLKLVRLRQREAADSQAFDELFGVRFTGEDGRYEPGRIAAAEAKKLPASAVAVTQQLALWLPADGRLLWQLAELANAHGDVRTAAAILDGCVTEFGLHHPELRRHRQILRTAAEALAKVPTSGEEARAAHTGHKAGFKARSARPLLRRLDLEGLPPVRADGVNELPWAVLAETTLGQDYQPTFTPYLQKLNGKEVALTGFMQPFGASLEVASFLLIEYPVGCWYCEMPELTNLLLVELPRGQTATYTRGVVKVTGTLRLNATDPEDFLYRLEKARVNEAD